MHKLIYIYIYMGNLLILILNKRVIFVPKKWFPEAL